MQQYLCTTIVRGLATSRVYEYGKKEDAVHSIAGSRPHTVVGTEVYSATAKPTLLGTVEGHGRYAESLLQPTKPRKRKPERAQTNNAAVPLPTRQGNWYGFLFLDEGPDRAYWAQQDRERVERSSRATVVDNMAGWTARYGAVWIDDALYYSNGDIAGEIRAIPESGHVPAGK